MFHFYINYNFCLLANNILSHHKNLVGQKKMVLTPQKLATLAKFPLLKDSWYFIAAATLSVCNQPQQVPVIYHFALKLAQYSKLDSLDHLKLAKEAIDRNNILIELQKDGKTDDLLFSTIENINDLQNDVNFNTQYDVSLKLREAILKSIALGGIPKAINTLMQLKNSTPLPLRSTKPQRDYSIEKTPEIRDRGSVYWNKVYGKVSERVTSQMNTAYPDLWEYTKNHVYAPLLSYSEVLPPRYSSLVIIACLIPQDVNPQLKGHLKGALNQGCSLEEIKSCRELSLLICDWCHVNWTEPVAKL